MSVTRFLNIDIEKIKLNNRKREDEERRRLTPSLYECEYEQLTGKKARPLGTTYSLNFIEFMKTKKIKWNIQNGIHISYVRVIS